MTIKTQDSMSGFIVTTPALSQTDSGEARLYMRVGQAHYLRNEDGSFTETEPSFHDLVMFRKSAERAAQVFVKGDRFLAEGYLRRHQGADADGVPVEREEFVARRIGHDAALTDYTVDRSRRAQAQAVEPRRAERATVAPGVSSQAGLASFSPVFEPAAAVGM